MATNYDEVVGATAENKTVTYYDPDVDGGGDGVDGVSYDTFDSAVEGIVESITKIFGGTDATKETAKAKSVTLTTTPTATPPTSISNNAVVAKNAAAQSEFGKYGLAIPLAIGDIKAAADYGVNLQSLATQVWEDPKQLFSLTQKAISSGIADEVARRRNKGETAEAAIAEVFLTAAAALASGKSLGSAGIFNLIVNSVGKVINQSQNVKQTTNQPEPEDSTIAQQNAEQAAAKSAAIAAFATARASGSAVSVNTNLLGSFISQRFAGQNFSFKSNEKIVYSYPEEQWDGSVIDVPADSIQEASSNST